MRRNIVVITMEAKDVVDELDLESMGGDEEGIRQQKEKLEEMLSEYSAYDEFYINVTSTIVDLDDDYEDEEEE